MHQFYSPDIKDNLILPESDSQHCVRVLRLKEGDMIEVVDGKGCKYICKITIAHSKKCAIEIIESVYSENHWGARIVLGVAPTKNNDRIEWMSEKMTELGVDEIIPIKCRHSERKEWKTERINKKI